MIELGASGCTKGLRVEPSILVHMIAFVHFCAALGLPFFILYVQNTMKV